jgi:hypothetical protein
LLSSKGISGLVLAPAFELASAFELGSPFELLLASAFDATIDARTSPFAGETLGETVERDTFILAGDASGDDSKWSRARASHADTAPARFSEKFNLANFSIPREFFNFAGEFSGERLYRGLLFPLPLLSPPPEPSFPYTCPQERWLPS